MNRLPIGRVRIERPQKWPYVRVPDFVLKTVGFVAEVIRSEGREDIVDLQATGFFVSVPSRAERGTSYQLFVTARHVAEGLRGKLIDFIVNKRGGGVTVLQSVNDVWYTHPSDRSVDVAVTPFNVTPDLDINSIPVRDFLTKESMAQNMIGIGDEVFIPGLFTYAPGEKGNVPILRHGNIAMLPDAPIQLQSGFADVYLIEARSIPGISGSPVFVRPTVNVPAGPDYIGRQHLLHGLSGAMYLMGLAHGHWDIRESDINMPRAIPDSQRGVNMGIGVVIPAHKILEVINHPELVALREKNEEEIRLAISPTPDVPS